MNVWVVVGLLLAGFAFLAAYDAWWTRRWRADMRRRFGIVDDDEGDDRCAR